MRETIQVARETKNTKMAWVGNSVCTERAELRRPAPTCNPNMRAAGGRNPIPAQVSRRMRSLRPQGGGCKECPPSRAFEPWADACSLGNSLVSPGPELSGMDGPPVGRHEYDSRTD